jgi:hypothetical protein
MQQAQEEQKLQLEQQQKLQQQQQKQRPPLLHQRPVSTESRKSAGSGGRKSANLQPPPKSPARVSPRAVSPGKKQDLNVPVEQPPPVKKLVEMLVFLFRFIICLLYNSYNVWYTTSCDKVWQ